MTDDVSAGRGGGRQRWDEVPAAVRRAIEARLGTAVVAADSQPGGFSPGVAARLTLADGRRAFAKAASPHPNVLTPGLHRREARIAAELPASAPVPRLLHVHDDGEWIVLVFEDVDGRHPALPWRQDELDRAVAAVVELGAALTPAPVAAPPVREVLAPLFHSWRDLRRDPDRLARVDDWTRAHLDELTRIEEGWPAAAAGGTLVHLDIRADNLLLTPERVVVVDWPHASVGAEWLDLAFMLPSVAMQGGPRPWEVFDRHAPGRPHPDAVLAVVCALAGYLVAGGLKPDPPGLPTVRQFQRLQGEAALAWLRRLVDAA